MNTPTNTSEKLPEFTQVKRVNKNQLLAAVMYGLLAVVVPVAGFMGAMKIDQARNSTNEPQVLGASVSKPEAKASPAKSSVNLELPVIGDVKVPSVANQPQLILGIGALLGLVAIGLTAMVVKDSFFTKVEPAVSEPTKDTSVLK